VCVCVCVCVSWGTQINDPPLSQGLPASIADSAEIEAPVAKASLNSVVNPRVTASHGAYVSAGFMHVVLCVVTLMISSLGVEKY
jgi:hypothetical protein